MYLILHQYSLTLNVSLHFTGQRDRSLVPVQMRCSRIGTKFWQQQAVYHLLR